MPTKLLYKENNENLPIVEQPPETPIGFCKESPIEVLEMVFETHNIYFYKKLYAPVDRNLRDSSDVLIIKEAKDGLTDKITKSITDFDLSNAEAKPLKPRTEKTYRNALRECIEQYLILIEKAKPNLPNLKIEPLENHKLKPFNPETDNYLLRRERIEDPILEAYISQLFDVAKVALKIKNPSVEYLKGIYGMKNKNFALL